jgi:predicted metal-dependent HD superfamily phosphohydrolase
MDGTAALLERPTATTPPAWMESAFAILTPDYAEPLRRLRARMASPAPRPYHNEAHIAQVLECLFTWSAGEPPDRSLIAAALYHDAIYDPTRSDNEARSGAFCAEELARVGIREAILNWAETLILTTARHDPDKGYKSAVKLVDADLYVLGGTPNEYIAYVAGIREEYAHVSDADWRVGRGKVLQQFQARKRIYQGDWRGHTEREAQARKNIAAELDFLASGG